MGITAIENSIPQVLTTFTPTSHTPITSNLITMGWFSSDEKSAAATHPVNLDVTTKHGSAAEQDRYGQHFGASTDAIRRGVDKGLDKLQQAALAKGDGAEQDRYNAHFSPALHSIDAAKAVQAAGSVAANGEKNAKYFGLGYDGQQRAKLLAGGGMGAEQDRLGSHFHLTKDAVADAAQRLKDGAKDILPRR